MFDRFDLEQAITSCFHTSDDIRLLSENIIDKSLDVDDISNALMGIEKLHDMRIEKVFDIFEELIRNGSIR